MHLGERRKFKTSSHLYSRTLTINFFRLCWVVVIIWGELGVFYWSLSSCKWPELYPSLEKPTRVLLVADPQVQVTLEIGERPTTFSPLRRFIFDLNLKKSWHVTTRLRPNVVIFLGDMLAGGRFVDDEIEYQKHVHKFKSMFTLNSAVSVFYIPGNNDVGMGVSSSSSRAVRNYYSNAFGPFNQRVVIRNHTFLLIDAAGLVDEDYQRAGYGVGFDKWSALPGGTTSFVKNLERGDNPLFLLSHIPLARPDSASCGPLREQGTIRRGVGHGYQNTLGKQTTAFLLRSLRPSAVYSGDNRDYCEYTHTVRNKSEDASADVREVTVKSFSMANHIRRPGFQLLTLTDPTTNLTQKSFRDSPCTLPDQYGIYFSLYLPFFTFTALTLVVLSGIRRRRRRAPLIEPLDLSPQSSGESTPIPVPESAIWSPYTPAASTSPRGTLPSSLRTPTTLAGPTLRASKPATPLGSPLLPPLYYSHEEDDESMYPAQYATRKDGQAPDDEEWSAVHNRITSDSQIPRFTSAPGLTSSAKRHWSWSWTFVFRGRRRRMSIRAATFSWSTLTTLAELFKAGERTPMLRHHVLRMTLRDALSIFWPVVIVWTLLTWWIF
ncbi:putative calcineurin-like phosphoesterase [Lyophyllum shimeji]|uniref:Calcineurin-like phosphoesterase n=1 Tax=Lyophyllum shimeji TaxID=47721 RepID=A0A9P3ULQ1_LYOSH|nr:putative calcineurin-like phosphoesterase [Lyophyllum shimeji]